MNVGDPDLRCHVLARCEAAEIATIIALRERQPIAFEDARIRLIRLADSCNAARVAVAHSIALR